MTTKLEEFIAALRAMADFYEQRPELPLPNVVYLHDSRSKGVRLAATYVGDCGSFRADTRAGLAAFARIVGGRVEKEIDGDSVTLISRHKGFSVGTFSSSRENICERVQVGTAIVPERVVPAVPEHVVPAVPEHVVPAVPEQVVPAREVPVYEWKCPPLLEEKEEARP